VQVTELIDMLLTMPESFEFWWFCD